MSGLFTMLGTASRALEAQRFGLDVAGHNIANANTPGYTRRTALLSELPPPDPFTAGRGVRIDGLRADRNRFLERRLFSELPLEHREAAVAEALTGVELNLQAGTPLDERLARFFDAFAGLADTPTSAVARQNVVVQGRSLASAFNELSGELTRAQQQADGRARDVVREINDLAARLAALNRAAAEAPKGSGARMQAEDEARATIEALSKLADVEAIERELGGYDVSIGSGRALVVGDHTWALAVSSRPVTGLADVVAHDGTVITGEIDGGALAGWLHARDTVIPSYRTALDDLAAGIVEQVNAIHQAGYDNSGAAGQPFFQPLAATTGAATLMTLNPVLEAIGGAQLVVASNDAAAAGDNTAARRMAQLRDQRVLSGNTATITDAWSQFVYRVGRDVQSAREEQSARAELVKQVETLRDATSGVSLDEEAANIMRFQRAYEANARYFRTVDEVIVTLLDLAG